MKTATFLSGLMKLSGLMVFLLGGILAVVITQSLTICNFVGKLRTWAAYRKIVV